MRRLYQQLPKDGVKVEEFLSRGKRVDNGEWVYGYFWSNDVGNYFIRVTEENYEIVLRDYEVIPETVGQYTGLTDKNGKQIFNDDILYNSDKYLCEERYRLYIPINRFGIWKSGNDCYNLFELGSHIEYLQVVGNIHDNPELLRGNSK